MTPLPWGVFLFILIVSLGLLARFYLDQLRLLLVPRLAAILTIVILMAQTSWPTDTELTAFLADMGVTTTIDTDRLNDYIDAAIEQLEDISGRSPYLVDGSDVTEKFLMDGSDWLDLKGKWTSITSITIDGTALTVNEDFWLDPFGGPYTVVRFLSQWVTYPDEVVIVGKRGTTIPQRVYDAVLKWASGEVIAQEATAGTIDVGEVTEIKQDSVTLKFAGSGTGSMTTADRLKAEAETVFRRERRMTVGNWVG